MSADDEARGQGHVPCVLCRRSAWPLQIALGQQVYTLWLCPEHMERCRADFGRWLADWIGGDVTGLEQLRQSGDG